MKKLLLFLMLLLTLPTFVEAQNKAYKAIQNFSFREERNGKWEKIDDVAEGDTLYATEETVEYIQNSNGTGTRFIPVRYKDKRGNIDLRNVYPIKLLPSDTLVYDYARSPEDRSFIERYCVKEMNFATNLGVSPMNWVLIVAFSLVGAVIFAFIAIKTRLKQIGLILLGISLLVASVAETMELFSTMNLTLWFVAPGTVGWGRAIVNLLLFALICAVQGGLYVYFWSSAMSTPSNSAIKLDDDDDEKPWYEKLSDKLIFGGFVPIALGVLLMILRIIDSFCGNNWPASLYYCLFGVIGLVGVLGFMVMLCRKQWIEAVLLPICYIVGGVGIALTFMIFGLVMIVVLILAGLIFAGLAFVFGALFGSPEIEGTLPDGTTVKGHKDAFGNFKGNNGVTYKVK